MPFSKDPITGLDTYIMQGIEMVLRHPYNQGAELKQPLSIYSRINLKKPKKNLWQNFVQLLGYYIRFIIDYLFLTGLPMPYLLMHINLILITRHYYESDFYYNPEIDTYRFQIMHIYFILCSINSLILI